MIARRGESRPPVADQAERDAAVAERQRNVLIDAGAGTGKTSILVDRLINMVAPHDGLPPIPISRIAAVTFTRRAGGELRLRIRESLLRALSAPGLATNRKTALHDALSGLETAYVGTIHSFADRLLRLLPVDVQLSPGYEIVDDEEELIRETFTLFLDACETGQLEEALAGAPEAARAAEAMETVSGALHAGVRAEPTEREHWTEHGLSSLVSEFIRHRDVPPSEPPPVDADLPTFRTYAREFTELVARLAGDSAGVRWFKRLARRVKGVSDECDPIIIFREVVGALSGKPAHVNKRDTFADDKVAWDAWKAFDGDARKHPVRARPLRDDLLAPLRRWMACRLVRLFPVVVALYERVKARHRALDNLDLLMKLRNLLRDNKKARAQYQSLFDHIFIDEFQDTDPLQAEIVAYLSERTARANRWRDVELAAGKLTLVGDPKQSIYRFRRADVAMYDEVRSIVAAAPHLNVRLSVNFRSTRSLVTWYNDRFEHLLGTPADPAKLFDPASGEAFHQPLKCHRADGAACSHVHILPFDDEKDQKAESYRRLEGEVLAHHLRWLVEVQRYPVVDPLTEAQRPVQYGDIAVLAIVTTTLAPLFHEFDRMGVPYTARGGKLFLEEPLHRQFLLGLRAIADPDDGIAQAALLRPPFFAVDLADLVRQRAPDGAADERRGRARAAVELVRALRRRRFERSPGATARDLLERTAFGRAVALGSNGAQRLERLRELCLVLESRAAAERLDYDAVTARMREWIATPVELDPPHPVGARAVQVMTVHQAKGLEFPVVVLWDGRAQLASPPDKSAWSVAQDGRGWALALHRLKWEEPAGGELRDKEKRYADAERKRVVYVLATRARDLLVIPKAGTPDAKLICGRLLAGTDPGLTEERELYRAGKGATWARGLRSEQAVPGHDTAALEAEIATRWGEAAAEAACPRFQPTGISGGTELLPDDAEGQPAATSRRREGRYGFVFGETVHRAIGLVMRTPSLLPDAAVRSVAQRTALDKHLTEAAADVARATEALRREGLLRQPAAGLRLEYPVAGCGEGGKLLVGYADLVSATSHSLDVIDFKTDQPPAGPVEQTYPNYVAQVRAYGQLLQAAGVRGQRQLRCGLLFTADGEIRWV
ncbi:MAG: UvrD-helicase domain-containing protein [Candidatus Binatia bacterium]